MLKSSLPHAGALVERAGDVHRVAAAMPPADWTVAWSIRAGAVAPTAPAQRAALVELFIATNGSTSWSIFARTGWQNHTTGSDPCDNAWPGVVCSGVAGSLNREV